jgi:hypothetical protein
MGEQEDWKNEQDREDDRAYALIMKTLESSLGYRLVWALDRLGWRIATQQLDDHKFPAPYQSTAQWPHWMEPAMSLPTPPNERLSMTEPSGALASCA